MQYPSADKSLVVVGWGRTIYFEDHSDILQQAVMFLIDHNDTKCNNIVSDSKAQFCAGVPYTSTGQEIIIFFSYLNLIYVYIYLGPCYGM